MGRRRRFADSRKGLGHWRQRTALRTRLSLLPTLQSTCSCWAMASRIRVEQIARSLAALDFLVMGLSALVAPSHGFSLDHAVPQSSQANLSRLLMQREITLHQRSEAETLPKAFTLAQMTRHYWGEFAGSLQDLGLSAGPQLLAEVARSGGRLRMHHCRGGWKGIGQAAAGHCPDGWQSISLK